MAVRLVETFRGGLFKESIKKYSAYRTAKIRVKCIVKNIFNFVHTAVVFTKITDDKALMFRYQPHENVDKSHVISLFTNVFLRGAIIAISMFRKEIQMGGNMVQRCYNDC